MLRNILCRNFFYNSHIQLCHCILFLKGPNRAPKGSTWPSKTVSLVLIGREGEGSCGSGAEKEGLAQVLAEVTVGSRGKVGTGGGC